MYDVSRGFSLQATFSSIKASLQYEGEKPRPRRLVKKVQRLLLKHAMTSAPRSLETWPSLRVG